MIIIYQYIFKMENPLSKRTLVIISIVVAVIILLTLILSITTVKNEGCTIDIIEDFSNNDPLLLHLETPHFIFPSNGPKIFLTEGQSIRLACSGQNNYLTVNHKAMVTITCVYNKLFFTDDNYYYINELLKCNNYSKPSVQKTGKKCVEKYLETEIGFDTSAGFISLITTCFDNDKKDSMYSIHFLSSVNHNFTQKHNTKEILQDKFYDNLIVTDLYKYKTQQINFQKILQQSVNDKINKNNYFNRGHLAPKGDFIYKIQKEATLFYLNIAPQWIHFNSGNWNDLEISCRNFARDRKLNLIVYTGIYGNTKIQNNNNELKSIFLYENHKLSVPELFWKILYEPVSKSGTVFIGLNNPFNEGNTICTDICDKIQWLQWQRKNKTKGFSYCCEYKEVKKIITYLPDIEIKNILS